MTNWMYLIKAAEGWGHRVSVCRRAYRQRAHRRAPGKGRVGTQRSAVLVRILESLCPSISTIWDWGSTCLWVLQCTARGRSCRFPGAASSTATQAKVRSVTGAAVAHFPTQLAFRRGAAYALARAHTPGSHARNDECAVSSGGRRTRWAGAGERSTVSTATFCPAYLRTCCGSMMLLSAGSSPEMPMPGARRCLGQAERDRAQDGSGAASRSSTRSPHSPECSPQPSLAALLQECPSRELALRRKFQKLP